MCAPAAVLHGRLPIQRAEVRLQQPVWALHKCELCNQKGVERLDKGGCLAV